MFPSINSLQRLAPVPEEESTYPSLKPLLSKNAGHSTQRLMKLSQSIASLTGTSTMQLLDASTHQSSSFANKNIKIQIQSTSIMRVKDSDKLKHLLNKVEQARERKKQRYVDMGVKPQDLEVLMSADDEERRRVEEKLLQERFTNSQGKAGLINRRLHTQRNSGQRKVELPRQSSHSQAGRVKVESSKELTSTELKAIRKSLDPAFTQKSLLTSEKGLANMKMHTGLQVIAEQSFEPSFDDCSKILKGDASQDPLEKATARVKDLIKMKKKHLQKIFSHVTDTHQKATNITSRAKFSPHRGSNASLHQTSIISIQPGTQYVDEVIESEELVDDSANIAKQVAHIKYPNQLKPAPNLRYRFNIDTFNDKVVMEKSHEIATIQPLKALFSDPSIQIITQGDSSVHFAEPIFDSVLIQNIENLKEFNALGLKDRPDQDFIINIDSFDNFNFNKTMREYAMKQCSFALKPKLSGNVDLRLNRINLRKIEKVVREVKFIDNLKISDQVERVKQVFALQSITIMDDEMLYQYLLLRKQLFPHKPEVQADFDSNKTPKRASKIMIIPQATGDLPPPLLKAYCYKVSSRGEVPAARVNFRAVTLDSGHVAVMGGLGQEVFNDFKVYEHANAKWKLESYSFASPSDVPEVRFGHTMNMYGNQLVVLGGGGPQIPRMKSRKAYSDLRIMDIPTMHWMEQDFSKDGKHDRLKRMNHCAAILGGMLVVHGGLNTEENYLYDQIELFDFGCGKWIQAMQWKEPVKGRQSLDDTMTTIKGTVPGKLQMQIHRANKYAQPLQVYIYESNKLVGKLWNFLVKNENFQIHLLLSITQLEIIKSQIYPILREDKQIYH